MSENEPLEQHFDASLRVDNLPSKGRRLKIKVTGEQSVELAKLLEIDILKSLEAHVVVTQVKGGLHVNGELNAQIIQPSVVSFKPVEQIINENMSRVFLHGQPKTEEIAGSETYINMDADNDLPDYYEGTELDLYDYIMETLSLAIILFPRLEGEKMQIIEDNPQSSAFAVLASLKKDKT